MYKIDRVGPLGSCSVRLLVLLGACAIGGAGALDDILSYKSLVLGSLASGERVSGRVSRSSCHNYFMNVTDFGYNLVVDLDTRTTSSQLFLLVKASPILRHSLEDEHNYASYYQFKKQGDHHGVVVTSEHLSPGRWYIGVCNYVQEVALFDERASLQHSLSSPDDAAYTVVATLNRTKENPQQTEDCGTECQREKERPVPQGNLGAEKQVTEEDPRGFVSMDLHAKPSSCTMKDGLCAKDQAGKVRADRGNAPVHVSETGARVSAARGKSAGRGKGPASHGGSSLKNKADVQQRWTDKGRKRAEEEERRVKREVSTMNAEEGDGSEPAETLFWAVRAEALEKELERVREEMEIVKDELTGVLSHTVPSLASNPPLPPRSQGEVSDAEELSCDMAGVRHEPPLRPAASRRRRRLSALPSFLVALVPDTLLPGGELCDEVGVCIGGVCVGLAVAVAVVAMAICFIREREYAEESSKQVSCAKMPTQQAPPSQQACSSAPPRASASAKVGKGSGAAAGAAALRRRVSAGTISATSAANTRDYASTEREMDRGTGDVPECVRVESASSSRHVEMLERRCEELQEEFALDLGDVKCGMPASKVHAGEQRQGESREREHGRQGAREHVHEIDELMQALEAANQRVLQLENNARRWKEDAEMAEERLQRISREKAAAEKAAEVLESLLSQSSSYTPYPAAPAYSTSGTLATEQREPATRLSGPSGRRRPLPLPLRADGDIVSAPKTPTPTMQMSVSNPGTPTVSLLGTGMAPIGTPSQHAHTPSPHGAAGRVMSCGSRSSTRAHAGTPARNLGGALESSFDIPGSAASTEEAGWCSAPGTPMDGSAFAAFMGITSPLDCSLPSEALESESWAYAGCGKDNCGIERLCVACERAEGLVLAGIEGVSMLEGSAMDGWTGARERDGDGMSSVGGSEESANWPTRARGRRGGRRQKRVGLGDAAVAGGAHSQAEKDGKDGEGGDLATSMALAALGEID